MYEDAKVKVMCHGRMYDGLVVALERDIGLSIVEEDEKDEYLLCVHCAGAPQFREIGHPYPGLNEAVCDYVEACIRQNMVVDLDSVDVITLEFVPEEKKEQAEQDMNSMWYVDSSTCVFNQ